MNIENQQLELIKEKKWWKRTNDEIKNKIIELIEKNPIFGKHFQLLGEKNDQGEVEMISEVMVGKESVIIELVLISKITNQEYTQEYVINYKDSIIGGKCLIVLEMKDGQKWIVAQKITKPWISKMTFGAITAFFPDFSKPELGTFSSKTTKALSTLLSNKEWQIKKIIDLGLVCPDIEFIANRIPIFVIEIATGAEEILGENDFFLIEKLENVMDLVDKCDDALISSIILKFKSNQNGR